MFSVITFSLKRTELFKQEIAEAAAASLREKPVNVYISVPQLQGGPSWVDDVDDDDVDYDYDR